MRALCTIVQQVNVNGGKLFCFFFMTKVRSNDKSLFFIIGIGESQKYVLRVIRTIDSMACSGPAIH